MELVEAARVIIFAGVAFVLPQAAGYITYRWTGHKAVAFLVAPVVFFATAYVYWEYQASAIRAAHHYVCGAFGAASAFATWLGTLFHLLVGAILCTSVFVRRRTNIHPPA